MVKKLLERPPTEWKTTVVDTPLRKHKHLKYMDDRVKLRHYDKECRQITVTGLGREQPTLFLTNNKEVSAREIVTRHISRNTIENELGINVNFFHMDCLSSEVRLNVNLDVLLTIVAWGGGGGGIDGFQNNLKGAKKWSRKICTENSLKLVGMLVMKEIKL